LWAEERSCIDMQRLFLISITASPTSAVQQPDYSNMYRNDHMINHFSFVVGLAKD
ncbi:uncharacterized, partial [Tachysurus ichikawai]